jgi:hypothetical protein
LSDGPTFDGLGPYSPGADRREQSRLAYLLSDCLMFRGDNASTVAMRWLHVFAIDDRAAEGALRALNELPALDRRHLLAKLGRIVRPAAASS